MFQRGFLFLVFLSINYSYSQQEYNISIILNNINSVSFHTSSSVDSSKIIIRNDTTLLVNSSGSELFYLKQNNYKYYLILNNESNIEISCSENNTFSIIGTDAEFIIFLNEYYSIYRPKIDSLFLQASSADQFEIDLYDLLVNEVMIFYTSHASFESFDMNCQNDFKNLLKYEYLNSVSTYLISQKKDTSQIIPFYTDVNIKLLDRDLFNNHILDTSYYHLDIFQHYIFNSAMLFALKDYQYMTQENNNFHNFSIFFLRFIDDNIPKRAWLFFFHKYIYNYAKFLNQKTILHIEKFLHNHNFDKKTIDSFLNYYHSITKEYSLSSIEDELVFDMAFYLENKDGVFMSLNDFKGKILYIDIWASWCGPCRKQFPYAEKIKEQLSKQQLKKINFIYISIDNDYDKWNKSLESLNLDGYQFISPANKPNSAGHYFNVSSIPRYILINKNG